MTLLQSESYRSMSKENAQFLRIIDLPLKRDQHPMFSLGWNIFDVIDENSTLYQQSAQDSDSLP